MQPTFFSRLIAWFRGLFGSAPQPDYPAPNPQPQPAPPGEPPAPVTRRLSLIIIDPVIPASGGRRLSQVLGWNDSDRLVNQLIADLREVSHGYANYQIAERIVDDEFPVKADGFRYTPDEFLRCWNTHSGFHQPDDVDYMALLRRYQLVEKVNSGAVDEVWTVSFPYAGFYESRMAGPGAFWCNAPPLEGTRANRKFVIMAYNYERGVGEMLESYGHRAESILMRLWGDRPYPGNLWKQFTLYDKIAPGRAEVGNVHFAPNSQRDYDWGNPTPVMSRARNWQNFPDLSAPPVRLTSAEWGGGDIRAHHRWWFSLLPHVGGATGGISNNWWQYIVDPNLVR